MKTLALALFVVCGATAASAVETPAAGAAAAPQDVVQAARETKAKRKKSTAKVLTNEDVKKSKGKIHTTPNVSDEPVKPEPTLMEKHTAARAAASAAAEQKAKAEALVAALEKELAALEQSYYSENDLARRDGELVKKFNDVKAKLDAARAALPKPQ